jgi:hypothetical protein
MKGLVTLASFTVADVQIFDDLSCNENRKLIGTKAGYCYNLDGDGTRHSAKGCSVGHNLRVYDQPDCFGGGAENTVKPQKCVNLGSGGIRSIKCLG